MNKNLDDLRLLRRVMLHIHKEKKKIVDLCRLWHNYLYERPEDDLDECIFVIGDTTLVDIHNDKALKLSFLVHDINLRTIPHIRWAYLSELMP